MKWQKRFTRQRNMTPRLLALLVASACGVAGAGCSDDTYIATNEPVGSGGSSSGGAQTGGTAGVADGSFGGAAGSTAGAGGAAGTAGAAGTPNTGGTGGTGTECNPGKKEDVGTCQKCGTSRRTCDASGTWGSPVCEDQGACNPGDKTTSGCSDPCSEKTCGASCAFGSCGKKSGATCLYESGTNFQCCGTDKWQFCNSATCDWFACQACSAGSSCLSAC